MFATLLHVALFAAAIIGLLAIKQRRLRHIPTRRTHIPRRCAEGTIWLQRAVNAILDMLHCALAEQNSGDSGASPCSLNRANAGASSATPTSTVKQSSIANARPPHGDDSGSGSDAEVPSDLPFLNTLKAQLEEQINALLEDKGIASFADFRIRDWGVKPPLVKAVFLSHGGGAGSSSATSSNNAHNATSSGCLGGVPNTSGNVDSTLAGRRGSVGGGIGPGLVSGSSAIGSPNAQGPPLYPSLGGNQPLPSSMTSRGVPLGPAASITSTSGAGTHLYNTSILQPGEWGANDGVSSMDVPYSSISMRYRNASNNSNSNNSSSINNGDDASPPIGGVGRERSLASSVGHPSRMGGGSSGATATALGMGSTEFSGGIGGGVATASATASMSTDRNTSDTTRSLSVLEAEVEVEYSGNFSVSLNADIPIVRGRYLQVYASVGDVRLFAAHVRLRLSLEYEPATVESPQPQPYLLGTLWLVSDPVFDVAFHSTLTQYRIRDFFLIPKMIKFLLLRFLRNKLRPASSSSSSGSVAARHANARRRRQGVSAAAAAAAGTQGGAGQSTSEEAAAEVEQASCDASGLSFRIQLPADVVDGGEQWWSSMAHDAMSESPAPFLRTYHQ